MWPNIAGTRESGEIGELIHWSVAACDWDHGPGRAARWVLVLGRRWRFFPSDGERGLEKLGQDIWARLGITRTEELKL